jgi:anthranilate phosphoribosyltransferase
LAALDVSTTLDPKSVRDSTCQTMLCFVTAIRATSPTWRHVAGAQEEAALRPVALP